MSTPVEPEEGEEVIGAQTGIPTPYSAQAVMQFHGLNPSDRVDQNDLVKGLDLHEEEDENDSDRGVRRDGKDNTPKVPRGRIEP